MPADGTDRTDGGRHPRKTDRRRAIDADNVGFNYGKEVLKRGEVLCFRRCCGRWKVVLTGNIGLGWDAMCRLGREHKMDSATNIDIRSEHV